MSKAIKISNALAGAVNRGEKKKSSLAPPEPDHAEPLVESPEDAQSESDPADAKTDLHALESQVRSIHSQMKRMLKKQSPSTKE